MVFRGGILEAKRNIGGRERSTRRREVSEAKRKRLERRERDVRWESIQKLQETEERQGF